jgi:hypothetical protein
MISLGKELERVDWKTIHSEQSRMLLFWKKQRKFEMLQLENLLNEKQTILVKKMDFDGSSFFKLKEYGVIIGVEFLENCEEKGLP